MGAVSKAMPTVLRVGPYRFFFYSSDGVEPRHIHVQRDNSVAKFWLDPVQVENNVDFPASEIRRLRGIIAKHWVVLVDRWDEYFSR
jgi:hypothetical protein